MKHVAFDYLVAYIAWDLSLADLRKLVWNSIDYSTMDDEQKKEVKEFTKGKWVRFLEFVRGRY